MIALSRGQLIELALGRAEAQHVDTAIPQGVFDAMTTLSREDIAGWYYDRTGAEGRRSLSGRLLTQTECWVEIENRVRTYQLRATLRDVDVSFIMLHWPCWRDHVKRGEIVLEAVEGGGR